MPCPWPGQHPCPEDARDSCPAGDAPGRTLPVGSGEREKRQEEQGEMRNSCWVNKSCSDVGEGELPWSPASQAGREPPANKFLFDAVKRPDRVRLRDGENPEKNAREEGGSCPGTPQGSVAAGVAAVQELPVPSWCHLAASWRLKSHPCPGKKCQGEPGTPSSPTPSFSSVGFHGAPPPCPGDVLAAHAAGPGCR